MFQHLARQPRELRPETAPQGARVVAEKLRTKLRNLIFEGAPGKSFHITASIGLATYPADARTISDLMAGVDIFALDDFGSGYNFFHHLRELSFDFVKIDGAFVKNILTSRTDRALVRNLGRLCQDLGIRTVAEWVESAEVHAALREMDIDYVQGSYFGLPGKLFVAPHRKPMR